jgi:hypothetical protein
VDELVTLAFALGVPLASLLLPVDDPYQQVKVTPNTTVASTSTAWAWMNGDYYMRATWEPLKPGEMLERANQDYYGEVPADIANGERLIPGLRQLRERATQCAGVVGRTAPPITDQHGEPNEIAKGQWRAGRPDHFDLWADALESMKADLDDAARRLRRAANETRKANEPPKATKARTAKKVK